MASASIGSLDANVLPSVADSNSTEPPTGATVGVGAAVTLGALTIWIVPLLMLGVFVSPLGPRNASTLTLSGLC
jgi:hypothetical protein